MSRYPTRTVVDVWLYVLLYVAFTAVYVPLVSTTVGYARHSWGRGSGDLVLVLCAAMYVVVPVRLYRRCRALLKLEVWQCRGCGYDQRGLAEGSKCPECGKGGEAT